MEFKVSSPCPASWDQMAGDHKIRTCGECKLNVYNLAEMSREEVDAVVRKTGGQLCGRLYVRDDRMATVRDCPRGAFRKRVRRGIMVAAVLAIAAFGWFLKSAGNQNRSAHPAWVQTVLHWIDPEPAPKYMLGRMKCTP
jgi:hypothetical protein